LLLAPFIWLPASKRLNYARGIIFFAVVWPFMSTIVLFGANSSRHLYLASIGVATAFGLASSELLMSGRLSAIVGSVVIACLMSIYGVALISNVALYARNGQLSRSLAAQVEGVIADGTHDESSVIIVIPELPERQVVFWDYFYPDALSPPFRNTAPPANILSSFESCDCSPEEWKMEHSAALALLRDSQAGPVYILQWDASQSGFVTHILSHPAFWQSEYVSPSGPLLHPRRPDLPVPTLP
jgi:hypothetical protein